MGLKEWIIPQDHRFFDKLEAITANATEAAQALASMVREGDALTERSERIATLEEQGDALVHDMYELLNRSFITPIDHGDLAHLVTGLDDFVDYIDASSSRLALYDVEPSGSMRSLAGLIEEQAHRLEDAVAGLREMRDPVDTEQACIEIHSLENAADVVLNEALADLFEGDDAIEIIKRKEIIENLETASDAAEEAANIIGDVVMKNT